MGQGCRHPPHAPACSAASADRGGLAIGYEARVRTFKRAVGWIPQVPGQDKDKEGAKGAKFVSVLDASQPDIRRRLVFLLLSSTPLVWRAGRGRPGTGQRKRQKQGQKPG